MSKKRKKEKKKILNTSKVQKVVKCSHIYNVFKFKSTLSTCSSSKVPFYMFKFKSTLSTCSY